MANPGFIIAKKHTPQAWGFDALSAFPIGTPTTPNGAFPAEGGDFIDFSQPLPQPAKIAKIVLSATYTETAGTSDSLGYMAVAYVPPASLGTVAAGTFTAVTIPALPLPVGPADDSATYGYVNAFASGVTGVFASPVSGELVGAAGSLTTSFTFVPDVPETVYPAGTIFADAFGSAARAGLMYVYRTFLVQYLDPSPLNDDSNPTAW